MRGVAVAVVAALAVAPMAAQQPAQTPPVFRSASDLVEVDVVVQDKNGRFVSDLAPGDFEIREHGETQPIQQFYLHLTSSSARAGAAPGPAENVSLAAAPDGARRTFVVVFDDSHMTPGGFKRTQAAAVTLFSQHFRSGDVGGILIGGRMLNNRLTSDRDELVGLVKNAKPTAAKNSRAFDEQQWPRLYEAEALRIAGKEELAVLNAAVLRACTDDENACRSQLDIPGLIRQKAAMLAANVRAAANASVQSLAALMNGLARLDGRKTVVLLSEGFIAEDSWPIVRQAVELAARANTRIYTLDARGLDRAGMAQQLAGGTTSGDDTVLKLLNLDAGSDAMNSLAVDTGGFVIRNANFFDKAIAQIADDANNYYVLGYRPDAPQDGKFHPISVKVSRPGVVVRARKGYVATPRPAAATEAVAAASPAPIAAPPVPVDAGAPAIVPPDPVDLSAVASAKADVSAGASGKTESRAAPAGASAATIRLRPAASEHVGDLATGTTADADAKAGWDAYQRGDLESARTALALAAAAAVVGSVGALRPRPIRLRAAPVFERGRRVGEGA
jgi:VWFA-related protein